MFPFIDLVKEDLDFLIAEKLDFLVETKTANFTNRINSHLKKFAVMTNKNIKPPFI